jgi:hypothetical protein
VLDALIGWIESTRLNHVVQKVFWIIPVVQTIHILAVSIVMASMAMLDLRLMGLGLSRHSIASLAHRFMPWTWGALLLLLLSGTVLIIGEPGRSLGNWVFQLKMSLLLVAVFASLVLTHRLRGNGGFSEQSPKSRVAFRALGLMLLMLWVGIVTCGRWIAYVG